MYVIDPIYKVLALDVINGLLSLIENYVKDGIHIR